MNIFSNEELQQFASLDFSPQAMSKMMPKKKRNFWLDQLSTGTGIAGGIIGTGIAPIVGTALGAGIGSAGGELLENMIDPTTGDWGNVAQEGAIGAVLGGGPIKLGKAGFGALKGVGGAGAMGGLHAAQAGFIQPGAKIAGKTLGKEAGEQALKTSMGGKLTSMGNKALYSQYGTISKPVARSTNAANTVNQLADAGIIKPQDAERISRAITGTDGILNQQVAKAVGGAGKVPTNNVNRILQEAIESNGLVDKDAKSVIAVVNAQMKTLNGKSDPESIMKVMRNLEKRAANLEGKGGNYRLSTPERVDQANALRAVRDELQEQLYVTAGANKNLSGLLTPELREQLVGLQPKSKDWARYIDSNVMGAKDVGGLRSAQAPFVNIQKIIDEGAMNSFTMGGRVGNATIGGKLMDIGSDIIRDPAARASGKVLRAAGTGKMMPGIMKGLPKGSAGTAARIGIGGPIVSGMMNPPSTDAQGLEEALLGGMEGGQQYDSPAGNQESWNAADPSAMDPSMAPQQPQSGITRENILKAMMFDLQENGGQNLGTIQMLYEFANPEGASGGVAKLSQGTKNSLASADNALNTLSQLEGRFNAAGGGGGRIGGALKDFSGRIGFNDDVKIYNDMASASVTQIAKALAGSGAGTVSDMDAKVIMDALSRFNNNDNEAKQKFADLRQRLETAKQNSMMYGAGLEETLIPQQGAYY